jgi:mono/diheme cytochrome c family protein
MSDENKSYSNVPDAEPTALRSAAPLWIIVVMLVLIFTGGVYLDLHGGWFDARVYAPFHSADELQGFQPQNGPAAIAAHGKKYYESVCGVCHGVDGSGKPGQAPPLAGSEWVNAKGVNRLAHIPLEGLNGAITVEGKDWSVSMAAMGAALSDDDLAAVLTYVRTSWGNKGGEVGADEVKKVRDAIGGHAQPTSGAELLKMPE